MLLVGAVEAVVAAAPPPPPPAPRARWGAAIRETLAARRRARRPAAASAAAAAGALAGAGAARVGLRSHILATTPPAARSRHDLSIIDVLLQQCAPLAALSRSVRHTLARHARLQTYGPGDVLCRAGAEVDRLIVTISGQVDVTRAAHSSGGGGGGGGTPDGGGGGAPLAAPPPLRPSCLGAACLRAARAAAAAAADAGGGWGGGGGGWGGGSGGGFGGLAFGAVYEETAVAAGRVEAMVVPADKAAAVLAHEASPDELMRGLPALEWLPEAPLTALAANASLRQYEPGQVVLRQGADADVFAFVITGAVRLLAAVPLPPGALCGGRRAEGLLYRTQAEQAYQRTLRGERPQQQQQQPQPQQQQQQQQQQAPQPGPPQRQTPPQQWRGAAAPPPAQPVLPAPAAPQATAAGGGGGEGAARRRPSVPLLCLPPLDGCGSQLGSPVIRGPGDAGDDPGDAGDGGIATAAEAARGAGVAPPQAQTWAPLVQAIEAAMHWASKQRGGGGGGGGGALSARTPRGPRGALTGGAAGSPLSVATPWGGGSGYDGGPLTSRGHQAAVATAAATPRGAKASPQLLAAMRGPLTARRGAAAAAAAARGARGAAAGAAPPSPGGGRGAAAAVVGGGGGRAGSPPKTVRWSAQADAAPWGADAATPTGGGGGGGGGGNAAGGGEEGDAAWSRVFVELGRLGPGQCFGDVREGCGRGSCGYSAVADAPCDVLTVTRQARGVVARALGPELLPLLFEAAPEGRLRGAARTGAAGAAAALAQALEWEGLKAELAAGRAAARAREKARIHGSGGAADAGRS
ncbi:MAG: hypothetical protein J3K34DRAFT_521104 [Monoraphidium minutum]|nr:MAG: hypothetical protein J3K34DRAFT_521104 [Monoraphidium minutum]